MRERPAAEGRPARCGPRVDAGVTGRTLSLIEQGHANPKWATVRDIADALNVSMGDLAKVADKFAAGEK
jgi:transcriptional regulator with XRE-family HTH domain